MWLTGWVCVQRRLLQELNDTRMCNLLLVPEADEDIRWTQDKFYDFPRHKKGASGGCRLKTMRGA